MNRIYIGWREKGIESRRACGEHAQWYSDDDSLGPHRPGGRGQLNPVAPAPGHASDASFQAQGHAVSEPGNEIPQSATNQPILVVWSARCQTEEQKIGEIQAAECLQSGAVLGSLKTGRKLKSLLPGERLHSLASGHIGIVEWVLRGQLPSLVDGFLHVDDHRSRLKDFLKTRRP